MCAALLAFSSLLQGCGKTETASKNSTKEVLSESSEQQSTEPDKITFAFFCNLFIPEDMDMIEEALNEQTRKKINGTSSTSTLIFLRVCSLKRP